MRGREVACQGRSKVTIAVHASIHRRAKYSGQLVLVAGTAGRCYSRPLPLPLVAPFQPLAQFLGRLAFQRVLHQGAQARRPRCFRDSGSGHRAKLLAGRRRQLPWQKIALVIEQALDQRQADPDALGAAFARNYGQENHARAHAGHRGTGRGTGQLTQARPQD